MRSKILKNSFVMFMLIVLLAVTAGCGNPESEQKNIAKGDIGAPAQEWESIEPGQEFTRFNTQDIYGAEINEEIFKDYKLTLVNVWGTFCGPCVEEMPYLAEIQKEYQAKGINIVGIVVDVQDTDLTVDKKQIKTARDIAVATGADYPHLILSPELITERIGEIVAIPASFFVDSEGNFVGEIYTGAKDKEEWITIIESALKNVQ